MKSLIEKINESKRKEFSIYFNYKENSLALRGDENIDDKTGFKSIDEIVKTIYTKYKDAYINIIPSDKLIKYITK